MKAGDDIANEMITVFEFIFSKDAAEQTLLGHRQCLSLAERNAA
jgi:hypothetical protein